MVHNGVNQGLKLLDASLGKVLVLVMWLTLPIRDAVGSQDFFHLITYLHLCVVADELIRCSPFSYLILKCIDKLLISLHRIHIGYKGFCANKHLCNGGSGVNGRSIRVDGICCNGFIMPMHIQCWKRRLVALSQQGTHREVCVLCGDFKGVLNDVQWEPSKHRA